MQKQRTPSPPPLKSEAGMYLQPPHVLGERTQQTDRISTNLSLPVIIAAASLEVTGITGCQKKLSTAKQNQAEDCSLPHAT